MDTTKFPLLEKFLDSNDIRIGVDFSMTPPLYHHSLEDGFFNYFNTYHTIRDSFHLFINTDWSNRHSMSFNYSTNDFKESCVRSIIGFHRFFELYIKDILSRCDANLATDHFKRKNLNNVRQFLKGNTYTVNPKAINSTVEFQEALERFKLLKELYDAKQLSASFHSSAQYFFLLSDKAVETLENLSFWRNRISHNGKKTLNYIALEYFVSQRIVPLVIEMYKIEKSFLGDYFPKYLRNAFQVQILDEIVNKVKFEFNDFFDSAKRNEMEWNLMFLAHLKELGRASVQSPFALFATEVYEEIHNKPLREKFEKFVELEQKLPEYFKLLQCPCCGTKSLVVYRITHPDIWNPKKENEKYNCRCYACTYEINSFNIDPFHIGLMNEPLYEKK